MAEQKSRKEGTFCSKVPDASTKKTFPQQRNRKNNFIKMQRGLAVPHLGSWRQPTEPARHYRAPYHWILTTPAGSYTWRQQHKQISRDRLHGLFLFHDLISRLFSTFATFVKIIIPTQSPQIRTEINCFEM